MHALQDCTQRNIERVQATPLVQGILDGKPDRQQYIRYLIDVFQYAQHSPVVISLAASRCVQTHPELGRYLFRHAEEEVGHEFWALSDLKDCGLTDDSVKRIRPTPACTSMIALEYYVAGTWNPVALFGWLFALESLGDAMGTLVSERLRSISELRGRAVHFLEGHGVADHQHAAELEKQIMENITDSRDLDDTFYIADVAGFLYARMLTEANEWDDRWLSKLD